MMGREPLPPLTESMESLPLSSSSSSSSPLVLSLESQYSKTPLSKSLHAPNFEITVSDPQKQNAVSVPFITYLITTPNLSGGPDFTVRRRFRDFVTLADRLAESHRGFFIPPRPDKSVLESQVMHKHDFVELRRVSLEKYLQKLAAHPVIGRSEELRVFLHETGILPLSLTTDMASRIGKEYLVKVFKEMRQLVKNDLVGAKPLAVEEDEVFVERKGRVQDFAVRLNASLEKAEALVKAQQEIAETMGELGLSFVKLVKLESNEVISISERSWAVDAKVVAPAAVKASRLYRELNAQTIRHLETLHDYTGLMPSIQNAFSERSNALLTVQTLLSDLASWHARAEKLEAASVRFFGGNDSRIQRIDEIRRTIRITEDVKSCAAREYEKIKENNRYELERFEKDRQDDFLNMLKGLTMNQMEYFEKIANVWERVASETSHYAKANC